MLSGDLAKRIGSRLWPVTPLKTWNNDALEWIQAWNGMYVFVSGENVGQANLNWIVVMGIKSKRRVEDWGMVKKIKALILNKYVRVNVRQMAFKYWLAQISGFALLATVAILYQTTQ